MICIWKQSDDNEVSNIGENYFKKYYFCRRFVVWGERQEHDQFVYIGQNQLQKIAEFSESTIFLNVLRELGLFQNQLKSDDVSARVLMNAHLRSDERSASNCRKKVSCLYFQINEDIAVQVKVLSKD